MHATEPFKFAYSCAHSVHERMGLVMTNERLNPDILNKYIFFSVSLTALSSYLMHR